MNPRIRSRAATGSQGDVGSPTASGSLAARRSRTAKAVAVVAVTGFALVGCAAAEPGAAAVVGETTISQATIGDQMRALNETVGQPADTAAPAATRGLVTHSVTAELIDATTEKHGVSVTDAEVEEAYRLELKSVGGEKQLLAAAAQGFVPPSEVRKFLSTRLAFSALSQKLSPTGSAEAQTELALNELVRTGDELGVEVAARYGEWNSAQLQIVPLSDPVSIPEAPPENPLGQLIPQQ